MNLKGRTGLFGGTFDPIHRGHLTIAATAHAQYGLARVLFVPNGQPPDPKRDPVSAPEDRFQMVVKAIAGDDRFGVSRIEIERPGPSYTIDTLRAMKDDIPEGICFIVGADRLSQIASWKEPEAILALVPIVVAPRCEATGVTSIPHDGAAIFPLDMPKIDVSSTDVRERARRGLPLSDCVPQAVAAYIDARGLYRDEGRAGYVEGGRDTK